jgi:hypothetical protein
MDQQREFDGDPQALVRVLTEIDSIESWSPVPFRLGDGVARLCAGDQLTVEGALVGRGVRFLVNVEQADDEGLRLCARGPFEIDVGYTFEPEHSNVAARVETRGGGAFTKLLASAANALLSAGALDRVLSNVVRQAALGPVPAAAL